MNLWHLDIWDLEHFYNQQSHNIFYITLCWKYLCECQLKLIIFTLHKEETIVLKWHIWSGRSESMQMEWRKRNFWEQIFIMLK